MELVRLPTVDSTSTRAAELLAQGKAAPFAVWADEQTGGRGRRGSAWQSPRGNLYLTLALPPFAGSPALQGGLPLKAGVLLARVIQRRCGLRVTLKWPNDVLFGGKKLAGLLLESSSTGGKAGEVLVGLGLNVSLTPKIEGASYQATSLQEILGAEQDVGMWARAVADAFAHEWNTLGAGDVPAAFAEYAIAEGELWKEAATGALHRGGAIEPDGTLTLRPLAGGEPLRLASADHGWSWVHLSSAPMLVADVGNTSVKLARFSSARDPEPSAEAVVACDADAAAFDAALAKVAQALAPGTPVHALSVNPPALDRLAAAAKRAGFRALALAKRPVRRHGGGYELSGLGGDRLAAIEGWLASLPAERRGRTDRVGVLVAAGTATTVDVVRADGEHLGGLIFPGLRTGLKSLHRMTALLPDLEPPREPVGDPGLGHDTRGAMLEGVRQMTVGAVERIIRMQADKAHPDWRSVDVVVTGGYAASLAGALGAAVDPRLILKGVRALALGG